MKNFTNRLIFNSKYCVINNNWTRRKSQIVRMKHTNRLINEKSPYLLQHAHNPVDWFPWGKEAFEKAQLENKPIFLSVGYSVCHWCHVMEKESFENEKVAEVMNEHFVNVKVDRETMPDVDKAYMTFVQATTRSGGWPMSVWMTSDLKPFYGGTYFPPRDTRGRPGFMTICQAIGERWKTNPDKFKEAANVAVLELQEALQLTDNGVNDRIPAWSSVDKAFQYYCNVYDSDMGGFSDEPKFPTPVVMNFLLTYAATAIGKWNDLGLNELETMEKQKLQDIAKELQLSSSNEVSEQQLASSIHDCIEKMKWNARRANDMVLHTLKCIKRGGIHDHIANGFHRYSTDRYWHCPHFEKMLYDQAQLLSAYSYAYQVSNKDPLFADAIQDILQYVERDLLLPQGGFYSAQDADSYSHPDDEHKKEGAFAVWTMEELKLILEKDTDVFCYYFGVKEDGNVDPSKDIQGELEGQNILFESKSTKQVAEKFKITEETVETVIAKSKQKLFEVRQKRPQPHLDDKIICSWNGLMISGLASAHRALKSQKALNLAQSTTEFIRKTLFDEQTGHLKRAYRDGKVIGNTTCDDYAFMIQGLMDLYECDFNQKWLEWAVQLQKKQDELFWDEDGGGYFTSSNKDLVLRLKDDHDGAEPSANSISCKNLVRLQSVVDGSQFETKAKTILSVYFDRLMQYPHSMPQLMESLILFEKKPVKIMLVGEDDRVFLDQLWKKYSPLDVVIRVQSGTKDGFLYENNEVYRQLVSGGLEKPAAYVCRDFSCGLPITDPEDLNSR